MRISHLLKTVSISCALFLGGNISFASDGITQKSYPLVGTFKRTLLSYSCLETGCYFIETDREGKATLINSEFPLPANQIDDVRKAVVHFLEHPIEDVMHPATVAVVENQFKSALELTRFPGASYRFFVRPLVMVTVGATMVAPVAIGELFWNIVSSPFQNRRNSRRVARFDRFKSVAVSEIDYAFIRYHIRGKLNEERAKQNADVRQGLLIEQWRNIRLLRLTGAETGDFQPNYVMQNGRHLYNYIEHKLPDDLVEYYYEASSRNPRLVAPSFQDDNDILTHSPFCEIKRISGTNNAWYKQNQQPMIHSRITSLQEIPEMTIGHDGEFGWLRPVRGVKIIFEATDGSFTGQMRCLYPANQSLTVSAFMDALGGESHYTYTDKNKGAWPLAHARGRVCLDLHAD